MTVIIVTSDKAGGTFGAYTTEDKAYRLAYGRTVKSVDRTNHKVNMTTGETLHLQIRILDAL